MSDALVAKRYAHALHEVGRTENAADALDGDVALVVDTLQNSRELRQLFVSPIVGRERKAAVIKTLFDSRVSKLMSSFLEMLVTKGREDLFESIARAYRSLRDEEQGIVEALVRTPFPLSAESEAGVRQMLERRTGKKVRLTVDTDASLIGGVVVRLGDQVYDGSVSNHLSKLKEQFAAGGFQSNGA